MPDRIPCGTIRLPDCPADSITVWPRGLGAGEWFRFENPEKGETFHLSVQELEQDGFVFKLPARSGALWFYQRARD